MGEEIQVVIDCDAGLHSFADVTAQSTRQHDAEQLERAGRQCESDEHVRVQVEPGE